MRNYVLKLVSYINVIIEKKCRRKETKEGKKQTANTDLASFHKKIDLGIVSDIRCPTLGSQN